MKKTLRSHKISVVLLCLLCLPLVFAEAAFAAENKGDSLFFLSPTYGWYFPASGKTKDAFGDSWGGWGIAVNLEALGWGTSGWEVAGLSLRPYFGYFHADKGDNDAHIIPVGIDARWDLMQLGVVSPYVGVGVAGYGIRFEDREAGVDTGWRGAFGGRLMFGADITRWFNIQAAYNLISDVEGYNLSGFSLQGKLKIYF
ncbi:MAG: hypothetical protein LBO82_08705 [Synergistaceae bacterium]|jgi:hypothetical protein|nr:hypothetical protein [Synergistaceae bacterium]